MNVITITIWIGIAAGFASFWGCLFGVYCGMRMMLPSIKALLVEDTK